jgi:SAM-dependent methyltransferase
MSKERNRYGAIAAEIYDVDKPLGALSDTAFHLARFRDFTGSILEPACGSGRTLLPLLRDGRKVAGFDASPEMLARCRTRCLEEGHAPDLSVQRFEDFEYDTPFDAILVPVGSFTLIDTYDAALAVLERFRSTLRPEGLLVLDVPPLASLATDNPDRRQWLADNGDLLTLEAIRLKTDWLRQRCEVSCRYERWRERRLLESELELMAFRYWGLQELRVALERSGFGKVSVCGGYERREPRQADRVWTFEAQRR